jgi:hypothetical protein
MRSAVQTGNVQRSASIFVGCFLVGLAGCGSSSERIRLVHLLCSTPYAELSARYYRERRHWRPLFRPRIEQCRACRLLNAEQSVHRYLLLPHWLQSLE